MEIELLPIKTNRSSKPSISFSKSGLISISPAAVEALKISDKDYVSIGKDKARPIDWYLIIHTHSRQGIPMRKKQGRAIFNACSWTNAFFRFFTDGEKSVSVPLATEGEVIMEGTARAYAILTSAINLK